MESLPNCQKVDIVQTYLLSATGKERRVRARGQNGHYIYYLTEKEKVSTGKRAEIERRLTQEEYVKYSMEADPGKEKRELPDGLLAAAPRRTGGAEAPDGRAEKGRPQPAGYHERDAPGGHAFPEPDHGHCQPAHLLQ